MRACAPLRGRNIPILPGQVTDGSIDAAGAYQAYTFTANAGDIITFALVAPSGSSVIPAITVYNPDHSMNSSTWGGYPYGCSGYSAFLTTAPLKQAGMYTVDVSDCSNMNTGNFELYTQRLNNPSNALNLPFGQVTTGSTESVAQYNTYTFKANAKDVIEFTLVAPSGSSVIPAITVYNPDGETNSSTWGGYPYGCSGYSASLTTAQLPSSGTYTVLVGDCGNTNTGKYALYTQRTNNPGGVITPILWGQVQPGIISSPAQSNTYSFQGSVGDVITFLKVVTTSGNFIPAIALYNPDGSPNSSTWAGYPYGCSGSTADLGPVSISKEGNYTVRVADCLSLNSGTYDLTSQCLGTCLMPVPVPTPEFSPNGGTYSSPLMVKISDENSAATIYYGINAPPTTKYTGPISVTRPETIEAVAKAPGYTNSPVASAAYTFVVATPVFSLPGSTYSSPQTVKITDTTPGATIHYTTDGTNPATSPTSLTYKGAIPVTRPETIKAIAEVTGFTNSDVASATYSFMVATPMFTPAGGTYPGPISVMITDTTPGATIYYGINGPPTIKYTAPIEVGKSETTINAIALVPDYAKSPVASATYTFITATPVFSLAEGTYTSVKTVTITDEILGAVIYYTTNGSTPTTSPADKYSGSITLSSTETIKAIAVAPDDTKSTVASATYTIIGSPSALAAPATAIGTSTATLNAIVNTNGLSGSYYFEYGPSSSTLTKTTSPKPLAPSTTPVMASSPLTGLASKTTYYYRVVATTKWRHGHGQHAELKNSVRGESGNWRGDGLPISPPTHDRPRGSGG